MPTLEEIKEIERVIGKPIEEIDELSIPAYIRDREFKEEMDQVETEERRMEDLEREEFFNN